MKFLLAMSYFWRQKNETRVTGKNMLCSMDFEHPRSCSGLINILLLTGSFILNIKAKKCWDAGLDSFTV